MASNEFKKQYEEWDKSADDLLRAAQSMNYDTYKQGDEFKSMEQDYTNRGNNAMQDTLAQVSARTGGLASSYATRAANNSYNDICTLKAQKVKLQTDKYLSLTPYTKR